MDVRDLADVAVAALIDSRHKNKIYSLTGPEALTFEEMADGLLQAVGRTISFMFRLKQCGEHWMGLVFPPGKRMGYSRSSTCIVVARRPESNRE